VSKTRTDKKKKKYHNKLSALIKGLNAVGQDLENNYSTTVPLQTQYFTTIGNFDSREGGKD